MIFFLSWFSDANIQDPKIQETRFECHVESCHRVYQSKKALNCHTKHAHLDKNHYICNHCNKIFNTLNYLRRHLSVHRPERKFSCPKCPQKFKFKPDLARHIMIHSNISHFICHQCSKSFKDQRYLRSHKIRMHKN